MSVKAKDVLPAADSDEEVDCPICLDPMSPEDKLHVLQCKHHCGYNFCHECIESFIASSKDEYMEASDGNKHVKVFLHCPNCRSDLSSTIRDTLLLRKTDAVLRLIRHEEELNESQHRLRKAMSSNEVKEAVKQARELESVYLARDNREAPDFLRGSLRNSLLSVGHMDASSTEIPEYEEWGVEVDLDLGAHSSFRMPKQPQQTPSCTIEPLHIDPSLFAGLDFCLDESQRVSITTQMTSGDPIQLAAAALELHEVLHRPTQVSKNPPKTRKMVPNRSSVYDLILESNAAREREEKKEEISASQHPVNPKAALLNAERRQLERQTQLQSTFQKRFPLPVRMPKAVVLEKVATGRSKSLDISLLDNTWDGTVMDAYRKITIGFLDRVCQKETENKGVRRILGPGNGDVQVELPNQPRVLLSHPGRLGKQGAHRGDVVTHVDGVSMAGMNAAKILNVIEAIVVSGADKVTITLNAERSVAEALKRRALAISEDL